MRTADAGFGGALSTGNLYRTVLGQGSLLGLYDEDANIVDATGVSGYKSRTDHVIAWKVRDTVGLDNVPRGVSTTGDEKLIIDPLMEAGSFEHPDCGGGVAARVDRARLDPLRARVRASFAARARS